MPFASRAIAAQRRAEVRARDGETVCALQITEQCRAEQGFMDYETRDNRNPRQFTVDHVIATEEARRLGWTDAETDALDNLIGACRACNREKSDGPAPKPQVAPTWVNSRFAHLI